MKKSCYYPNPPYFPLTLLPKIVVLQSKVVLQIESVKTETLTRSRASKYNGTGIKNDSIDVYFTFIHVWDLCSCIVADKNKLLISISFEQICISFEHHPAAKQFTKVYQEIKPGIFRKTSEKPAAKQLKFR